MTIEGIKRDSRKYDKDAAKGFLMGSVISAPIAITVRNYMDQTGFARASPGARVAIVGANIIFGGLVGLAGYTNGAMRREISKRGYNFDVKHDDKFIYPRYNLFPKIVLGSFLGVLGVGFITVLRSPLEHRAAKIKSLKVFTAGTSALLALGFAFDWLNRDSQTISVETVDKIERDDRKDGDI